MNASSNIRNLAVTVLLASLLPVSAPAEERKAQEVLDTDLSSDVLAILDAGKEGATNVTMVTREDLKAKPDSFESWSDRLDYIHDHLYVSLHSEVVKWDTLAAENKEQAQTVPPSKFRFGLEFEIEVDGGKMKVGVSPDVEADIQIPNLEGRLNVFIDFKDTDELPGTTPSERTSAPRIGVGSDKKVGKDKLWRNRVGLKWKVPPVGFVESELGKFTKWGNGYVLPKAKAFYETDDGLGSVGSIVAERWVTHRLMGQGTTAISWTEKTRGVEWQASLLTVYLKQGFAQDSHRDENIHRGLGLQTAVFGHKAGSAIVDRYRLTLGYRIPLYKQWMYLTIYPEVQWRNENDWSTDPGVRVAFDTFIWGKANR